MGVFAIGDRVRATTHGAFLGGIGTVVDVRTGMYPYVVRWDRGGENRAALKDIERVPAADPKEGATDE